MGRRKNDINGGFSDYGTYGRKIRMRNKEMAKYKPKKTSTTRSKKSNSFLGGLFSF